MKYLITGGLGLVGCHLTNALLSEQNEVVVFDNMSRRGVEKNLSWLKEKHKDFEFIKGDIRDAETLSKAMEDVDVVYHTAGQVAVTTSITNPRDDFEINVLGTFNALEAARNAKTDLIFIFTSTNKVYGNMEDVLIEEQGVRYDYKDMKNGITEKMPLDFHSPYGCSKGAADQYVRDYSRIYGIKSVVFRMSCIYGTRQYGNEDQGWVAHFVISSVLNKPLTIYGDGKQVRDILFVKDLVNAFKLTTGNINKTKGEVYNIGGGPKNVISLLELIKYLEELLGRRIDYSFDTWRPGDQRVYYSNISKAAKDFGWHPYIPKEEGIKRLFDWVNENKAYLSEFVEGK
jgi:CDP-paratose 2-epimerase